MSIEIVEEISLLNGINLINIPDKINKSHVSFFRKSSNEVKNILHYIQMASIFIKIDGFLASVIIKFGGEEKFNFEMSDSQKNDFF